MKDKIQKEYLRRTRKLLETKLSSRNLIKGINTWTVPLVRYSGLFLKWTRDEPNNKKTNDNAEGITRGLASIEDNIDASIRRLEDYIENIKED